MCAQFAIWSSTSGAMVNHTGDRELRFIAIT
jgi:hypothetical protein